MKSCITINLKKDNIVIKINEDFSQEDIMYSLRKKIPELKKLYQSEKTPIVITGKVLKNREIDEIQELIKLTEVNIWDLNHHGRKLTAQISFDRPEVSPCLDKIRNDKQKYARAVEIIRTGQKRLKATPRGDIEKDLVPCERHKAQLRKYAERLKVEQQNCSVIGQGNKIYDK